MVKGNFIVEILFSSNLFQQKYDTNVKFKNSEGVCYQISASSVVPSEECIFPGLKVGESQSIKIVLISY